MKTFVFSLLIVIIFACQGKKNEQGQAKEPLSVNYSIPDSINEVRKYLIEKGVLDEDFPGEKIVGYAPLDLGEYIIGYIQIEYYRSSEKWNVEPVYNLLFLKSENEFCFITIPSSYPDDFTIFYQSGEFVIYQYYSSAVGFKQYYIFNIDKKQFHLSSKYDEADSFKVGQEIDTENVNLNECF